MSYLTRDFGDGGWKASGAGNPPPLHVRDTESSAANWFPYSRPFLRAQHPGPVLVTIPGQPPDELGEDPTDPARCHNPRQPTAGLNARLNLALARPNVTERGERR